MRQAKVHLRDAMPENSLFSRVMQDPHSFPRDKNEVEVFVVRESSCGKHAESPMLIAMRINTSKKKSRNFLLQLMS